MEVVFLGTGTSHGLPMIAFDHEKVDLDDQRNWRTRTSVHVVMDGFHIQVDAALELRLQCLHNEIESVDCFILTHGHADHILGMEDLRRFCALRGGEALPVYSTPEGLARVQAIFPYAIRDRAERKGYPAFQLHTMPKHLETPGGTISSVLLPHGSCEVLGLVFKERSSGKQFSYFTDCKAVPLEARELACESDAVVLDGLRYEPHVSHMTIAEAVDVAQSIDAPNAYITHITYPVDHATAERDLPEHIHLAYDGLRLSL